VQAVERSARTAADGIERLLRADDRQVGTTTGIPWNAIWPCAVLVLLIYIYLAAHMPMPNCRDYERLDVDQESAEESEEQDKTDPGFVLDVDKRDPALMLAAALYWAVMPIVLVTLGFGATCEEGASILAFITYGVCFAIHFACIFWAMAGSLKGQLHDSTPELLLMLVFAALEHYDMASDALFAGTSAACSEEITELWLKSWQEVPAGGFLVPVLSKLGFSGVALTMFVTNAYLPQLLVVWAPFAPFVALVFLTLVIVWAANSWWVGLPVMLAVLGLAHCSGFGPWQIEYLWRAGLSQDSRLAQYIGCDIGKLPDSGPGSAEDRAVLILGTKLVFENLLQLWLQSSYLSLSFDRMDSSARWQAMASIAVGMGVAGGKGLQIASMAVPEFIKNAPVSFRGCDIVGLLLGAIGVSMMLAGLGVLAWVVAKVVFIFRCDSHVWNLSTGCVSPEI